MLPKCVRKEEIEVRLIKVSKGKNNKNRGEKQLEICKYNEFG